MVNRTINKAGRKLRRLSPFTVIGVVVLIGFLGVFAYSHYAKKATVIIPTKPVVTPASSTTPQSASVGTSSPIASSGSTKTDKSVTGVQTAPSGTGPATPSGTFVSNHFPGKNSTSTFEESLCTTTPGATCYIQFTKGTEVKKLDSKTVDSSGSVIWDWDVKDAGMSQGEWKITAIATLNAKTASANDSISLEVSP